MTASSRSAEIRAQLSHPVIDADGHWLEPVPIFLDFLETEGGSVMVDRFRENKKREDVWYGLSTEERLSQRLRRPTWWGEPTNTRDRASAMIPGLMYERLDEFGVDFAIVYTTLGLVQGSIPDDELRPIICRALNKMNAELFAPYGDRLTPVATIPMHTPEEAISALNHAVDELGMKAVMIANHVRRPLESGGGGHNTGGYYPSGGFYIDCLAIESPHDYDPFWQACIDHKVAVTAHSSSMGWEGRASVNNFTFNHIGHFAGASHVFAKALIFGGVLDRFPQLRFGMLEGGVAWGCSLLADMIGHWEKRREAAMLENLSPTNTDMEELARLLAKYGGPTYAGKINEIIAGPSTLKPFYSPAELAERENRTGSTIDDYEAAGIETAADLTQLFQERFFFGCEADDPTAVWAYSGKTKLNPMFSSDVGHFDVIDMSGVLEEAFELVEDGDLDAAQFESFTFGNAARLHTSLNTDFFSGTVVDDAVQVLKK
jgi:predicted TIM-barrel fold metal-dependent hydrolase